MFWQKEIKKTIFLLNVDNYTPEITELTYPYIERYAKKIQAEIHIIKERKFLEFPVTYEKLQIYELAQKMANDWNIYIDSDALVHPDTPDFTSLLSREVVLHNGTDFSPIRFRPDRFFRRDGRAIGSCNWFTIASDWCIELWKPLDDLTPSQAIANIHPINDELKTNVTAEHLIDDYTLSRNIAKYGLKCWTMDKYWQMNGGKAGDFFWHQYQIDNRTKIFEMKRVIERWEKSKGSAIEKNWSIPKHD